MVTNVSDERIALIFTVEPQTIFYIVLALPGLRLVLSRYITPETDAVSCSNERIESILQRRALTVRYKPGGWWFIGHLLCNNTAVESHNKEWQLLIDLFVVYLTILSVTQTIRHRSKSSMFYATMKHSVRMWRSIRLHAALTTLHNGYDRSALFLVDRNFLKQSLSANKSKTT